MKKHFTLLLIIMVSCFCRSNAAVIYVSETASGSNNGTNWANAFNYLQDGIAASSPGDQIWIAAGTYKPIYVTNPSVNDRLVSFVLPNGVSIYGGFAGTETQLSQRDWTVNETVLSGNIGSTSTPFDNSHRVITAGNLSANTRLDGVKVISGYANGSVNYDWGGGMVIYNTSMTIENCTFTANYAVDGGGGISFSNGGSTTPGVLNLINCNIVNNTSASFGGGLYLRGAQTNLIRCNISENQGSTAITFGSGEFVMDRCVVSGNVSSTAGEATMAVWENAVTNFYNSLFAGNTSASGSVLDIDPDNISNHLIANCTVAGNKSTSTDQTFSFAINGSQQTAVRNCIIWDNSGNRPFYFSNEDVQHCIVQGGYSGTGNTSVNPLFLTPGNGTQAPFNAANYSYRLQASSPALNSGNNAFVSGFYNLDLLDSTRISAGTVDRGCYEKQYCTGSASINTSGPLSFCLGSFVTLSVPQSGTYTWSNGATSQSIAVSTAGIYSVTVIDSSGCFGTDSKQVTVYPASVQISGSNVVCSGATTTLTASSPDGNIFQWSNGTSGAAITVSQANTFTVTVTTGNNCTASASVNVSVQNVNVPFASQSGSILTSTPADTYQWYLNGNPIPAATSQNYTPLQNGNYYVVVTQNGCTSQNSNTITVLNVKIDEVLTQSINLYPNPASRMLQIEMPYTMPGSYRLCDLSGRIALQGEYNTGRWNADVSLLPSGVYFLTLIQPQGVVTKKIEVAH